MNRAERTRRIRRLVDACVGLVSVAVVVALIGVAVLVYNKAFTSSVEVTLMTSSLGNQLQEGSDVQVNGVDVGRVTAIHPRPGGAKVGLAIEPAVAEDLAPRTVARLLPKTLFGERYVSLIEPDDDVADEAGGGLSDGAVIHQDHSAEAVALQQVFNQLLPMLQAIQPAKLSAMLGEMAAMLRGQGEDIGDAMVAWRNYLRKLNPLVPQMTEDLARFADVASDYEQALPDLLDALESMTVTSRTLVETRTQLRELYANVITAGDITTGWVSSNQDTIDVLAAKSREALAAIRPYASQFPCLFRSLAHFVPVMDKTLGAGTDEPGIHVVLNIVPSQGKYLPSDAETDYPESGEPRCPYVDGQTTGTRPVAATATGTPAGEQPARIAPPPTSDLRKRIAVLASGLGPANSPAENQLIAELIAPTQQMAPAEYPEWASLLLGPTLRNAKVILR